MKSEVIAIAVAILVMGTLAAGYGIGDATQRTETLTDTSPTTTTSILTTTMQETLVGTGMVTETATTDATSIFAAAFSQVTGSPCDNMGVGAPTPGRGYYFMINVDYSGQWGGVASVIDNGIIVLPD